ncbi:IPT/TIG domain-containing protein [Mucilaginibacter myungsuensis]|uniref:IPT/TIG domain-containing protein n=1 Tax=Mucilaginibacter myungsuensis TaxID=649104 RepID=UPI001D164C97|nr:IPT/TIG domain-containing protein [Mucilaginibacter myungsuensis]MDN3597510.1 IPT/TIG domain-containing protein [Mucilaginibacter myungsuensis]
MASLFLTNTSCRKSDTEVIIPEVVKTIPGPTVLLATPNSGLAGTEVTITGTNFSTVLKENIVKFNGTEAVIKSATTTQLVVTAPTGGTSGTIAVKVNGKDAISIVNFTYGVYPTLTSLSPATAKPGDRITITGTNFSTVLTENKVSFNTGGAAGAEGIVVSATATQLVVEVPAAAVTGNVSVVSKLSATNLLQITITPVSQGSNISLFAPQSSNGIERFVVDARSNFYAVYNIGTFSVAGPDGVVKKTFTKADFANHAGNIVGIGKDLNGNACVAWNRYVGSKSFTTFFRIKADFTSEMIGTEVAPSQSSITMTRPFVVDSKGDVFYTDTFSVFKVENSGIDLTKRYLDGRTYPAAPYISDIQIDAAGNLYVLTKGQVSATENSQSIVKYDGNKNATTLFTVQTTTIPTSSVAPVPSTTIGEFKSFVRTPEGDIYVGDYSGNRIRKITGNNTTEIIAGSGEYGRLFGGYELTGPKLSTPVPRPLFIAYDAVKKVIYTSPYTYDKGSFVQVFAL